MVFLLRHPQARNQHRYLDPAEASGPGSARALHALRCNRQAAGGQSQAGNCAAPPRSSMSQR